MAEYKQPIRIELPTIFGMKTVNCFLFKDPVPTLIDCGENTDASWQALLTGLADAKLSITDIKRVIITHAHVDHMGMAARIAEQSGAVIWVNEKCAEWAFDVEERWKTRGVIMNQLIHQFMQPEHATLVTSALQAMGEKMTQLWPSVSASDVQIFPMKGHLQFGGDEWTILYLPGHSNTQTCFFNPRNGVFLSADMLLRITPTPVLEEDTENPGTREVGLLKMLNSFQQVKRLPISQVFPGHYEVFNNYNELIDKQVKRISTRKLECLEFIKLGQSDFMNLYRSLYGKEWHLPAFNMLIGYLDLLHHEGRISLLPMDSYTRLVSND